MKPLQTFARSLCQPGLVGRLSKSVIGNGVELDGPFGPKPLVYADYVASGRALTQVEDFIREQVLPYYANSHTEASFCGSYMTRLREDARVEISQMTGAGADCSTIFCGSGATAGINRLVGLLSIREITASGRRVVVLIGPYEHHSNILPWRESGAEVIEISEATSGGPDLEDIRRHLLENSAADLVVGSFSAASNVTGITCDVDAITKLLKYYKATCVWDYAGGAPYLPVNMGHGEVAKDAIVFSPHKFPGGPGSSGILIVRDTAVSRKTPTMPGGGTVSFVSPWQHVYSAKTTVREESGTPNIIGDIRAALAMLVKEAIGIQAIRSRDARNRARAQEVWSKNSRIELLGNQNASALPIFSFRVHDAEGGLIHHQLFTRMLSDRYGIQARGGCACAGPYAHRLLGIDQESSEALFKRLTAGAELEKPGWVRLNFSYLLSDEKVDFIVRSVDRLATECADLLSGYEVDPCTAQFRPTRSEMSYTGSQRPRDFPLHPLNLRT